MTPRKDVSVERRAQIVGAAMACFTRQGYINTSMDDIVNESGLSKGALYWYFSSKEDVFVEALKTALLSGGDELLTALAASSTAAEKLRAIAAAAADFGSSAQGYFSLFLEYWAQSADRQAAGAVWREILLRYKTMIVAVLEEGSTKGEFRSRDWEKLVWAMMAAYDGLASYRVFMPDLDLPAISRIFVGTVLAGLKSDFRS